MGLLDLIFSRENGAEVGDLICKANSGHVNYKVTCTKFIAANGGHFLFKILFLFLNREFR